ncbi:hypothetical protein ABZ820_14795 [Streptomyces diacarni]|uniref:hypothetical protein n=1 Tax=Streptomyces diacarni TaxID=2800381 RepID=UPI0033D401D0
MRTIRFANLNAYKLTRVTIGDASWRARVTVIKEITPDVLALQEVVVNETRPPSEWAQEASESVQQLASECGLSATTVRADGSPGPTAMANNAHRGWYTALLFNPDAVTPTPGGFRPYGAPDLWHGLTTAVFDIGASSPITVANYHGDPFRGGWRLDEAYRLNSVFRTILRGFSDSEGPTEGIRGTLGLERRVEIESSGTGRPTVHRAYGGRPGRGWP